MMLNGQNDLVLAYLRSLPKDECNKTRTKYVRKTRFKQKWHKNGRSERSWFQVEGLMVEGKCTGVFLTVFLFRLIKNLEEIQSKRKNNTVSRRTQNKVL